MVSRTDVIGSELPTRATTVTTTPVRERLMLGYYAMVAVVTGAVLIWGGQGHSGAEEGDEESDAAPAITAPAAPGQPTAAFPPAEVARFRSITQDTLSKLQAGDQGGAQTRITDLETAWDDDESKLKPMDRNAWHTLDKQIDGVLAAVRARTPNPAIETQQLTALLTALR